MKIGKSRHTRKNYCLNCGKLLDGCSGLVDADAKDVGPHPGAVTVCAYCQHLMVYDDDLKFRNPTFTELAEIASDPRVVAVKPVLKQVFR